MKKKEGREREKRKTCWLHCGACRPAANNSSVDREMWEAAQTQNKSP